VTRWLLSLQWILWCHSGIHSFLLTALSEVISIFLRESINYQASMPVIRHIQAALTHKLDI
jgi:hypothetical protein